MKRILLLRTIANINSMDMLDKLPIVSKVSQGFQSELDDIDKLP